MNIDKDKLKEINNDIIFFFLLIVISIMSFYIVINKKKDLLNLKHASYEELNKIFQTSHILQVIVNIYFVINAYNTLEKINKNKNKNEEQYNTQYIVLVTNVLVLISSLMYLPILDSEYVLTR